MEIQKIVKIFLASPMDLLEEREVFKKIINKINQLIGKPNKIAYEVIGWEEYTMPDLGEDAQDVVNHQIKLDYDIFVCLFKERIGTKTKRAQSGTLEEYERAKVYRISKPNLSIMAYFFHPTVDVPEINEVKKMMASDGALFWEIESKEIFESTVFGHFCNKLINYFKEQPVVAQTPINHAKKMKNAVSVALVDKEEKLLIVQRAFHLKVGGGLWQLPGGKLEDGENETQAAIREIKEELGLDIHAEDLLTLNQFNTFLSGDKDKPFKMTLMLCRVDRLNPTILLNEENCCFEWIDLKKYDLGDRIFLGINEEMILVVWRELFLGYPLRYLLDVSVNSESKRLPEVFPALTSSQVNMLYAFLSLLGVLKTGRGFSFSSEFGRKLTEEFLYILSAGNTIFDDDPTDELKNIQLPASDMKQLEECRRQAFHSKKSLVAYLSCKAPVPHSTRFICDTLIFGKLNEKKYLLMRWDFFAEKYQIVCSGLPNDSYTYEEEARYILSKRIPNTESFFDYQFVKSIVVHHFSAGSVDNDPILRRYEIDIVLLNAFKKYEEDILHTIRAINAETYQELALYTTIDREKSIGLKYYVWCDVEKLLLDFNHYEGEKVRGIEETIRNIGSANFTELAQNAIELSELDVDPNLLRTSKSLFKEKYRG